MTSSFAHIAIIDPALRRPELESWAKLARLSPLPLTYHLPGLHGVDSLQGETASELKGLLILGSGASVHDRYPWQLALESWLKPLLLRGLPTLGICYGHQMLHYMFGGRVNFVFQDRSKHLGMRQVRLAADLPAHAPAAWSGLTASMVVSHREQVAAAAPDFVVIASSAEHAHDGLAHQRLPIFSFQPHPEAMPRSAQGFGMVAPAEAELAGAHKLVKIFLEFCAGQT